MYYQLYALFYFFEGRSRATLILDHVMNKILL